MEITALRGRTISNQGNRMRGFRVLVLCGALAILAPDVYAQEQTQEGEQVQIYWQRGPSTGHITDKATIAIPEDYVFADPKETDKYLVATQNLPDGSSYFLAPTDDAFEAYFQFEDSGFIKDDEKLDPDDLLRTLKQQQDDANMERRKRGWSEIELAGWYIPPRYNERTKVLEWATKIKDVQSGKYSVNYFTKVLGRHGYTSVQVVVSPDTAEQGIALFQKNLDNFKYVENERYADFRPGDHVAEYGLAALVTGGVAAVAAKKGLFATLGAFFVAAWKFLLAGVFALGAWLRRLFGAKKADKST